LKAIAIGSGTVVASTMLPERWVKPVVQAGALPAHAQVSGEPVQYLLSCSINEDASFPGYELIDIAATVTATDGAAVEGVQVQYIAESITPPGTTTDPVFGTTDGTGSANLGDFFFCQDFENIDVSQYRIVLRFVDSATYGDATCTLGSYDVQGC
jgi:hypothetical protein